MLALIGLTGLACVRCVGLDARAGVRFFGGGEGGVRCGCGIEG